MSSAANPRAERPHPGPRLLVVRLSSMGDVIHALPAVATLKHSFPESELNWVVHPRWAPLVAGNPFVDRLIPFDRRSFGSIRATAGELRRGRRFQIAVDLQGLVQSALVAAAARPEHLYGFHQSQVREKAAALFYSDRVRSSSAHIVDRNLDLVRAAGASMILRAFPLPLGEPEGELPAGGFVLASPLAGWGGKQWPLDFYRVLAQRLREELDCPLVVNGPPSSADILERIIGAHVHLSGLPGLIDATRRATAVVGGDSGPLHLAAALGKPGVALFGPTDPARNGPYGSTFTVLRSASAETTYKRGGRPEPSMEAIAPDAVFAALRARLNAGRPASA